VVAIGQENDPGPVIDRPYRRERSVAIKAARAAGAAIRDIYGQVLEVSYKSGDDPLTIADRTADRIIMERVRAAFPADGWLSEEDSLAPTTEVVSRTWVVDPLDGTREFVKGIPEFAVSIALIEEGRPVVAVVYNPINDLLVAATRGGGVSGGPRPETTQHALELGQARVLASRSEVSRGQWAQFEGAFEIVPTGSIAYKLALVAFGIADATVSLAPKHGWDICAGVLLVEEAGGRVSDLDGGQLDLSRPSALMQGLIASHEPLYPDLLSAVAARVDSSAQGGQGRPGALEASAIALGAEGQIPDPSIDPSGSGSGLAAWAPGPVAPASWPATDESVIVAPGPDVDPDAQPLGAPPLMLPGPVASVGPRITRPEPFAAPFVIASTSPEPTDRPRSLIRTATIYALVLSAGVLLGFVLADVTRQDRSGGEVTPAGTISSGGLTGLVSVGPELTPASDVSASATAFPASAAGPAMVQPVTALGDRLTAKGIELDLAWQPPADGAPPSRYDLDVSRDGGAWRPVDLARKTSRSMTIAAVADHDYVFRLRARSSDGTPGAYAETAVRLAVVEESAPDLRASKGWKVADHPDYTGAGARTSSTKGAELSLAFEGTAVAIVGPNGPGRGRAEVFVDGEPMGRFDATADAFRPVRLLFTVDGLADGPHVLSVRVMGTAGRPMVAVDRFLVLGQP